MKKTELMTTLETLKELLELIEKGERYGWGYDADSILKTIAFVENEIKLTE